MMRKADTGQDKNMSTLLELYERSLSGFGARVHAVRDGQWSAPTPCTDWSVRELVNHLTGEQLWAPPMVGGATVEQIGSRLDGDVLGADPASAWDSAATAALAAFTEPGALDRVVHLSYGDRSAEYYLKEMVCDLVVHAWDLAVAIGVDRTLDPVLVERVLEFTEPHAAVLAASGLFDAPVPVPDDAAPQTRLIAMYGRIP
jgi:uncharacterized protein (TIGR03086 family)